MPEQFSFPFEERAPHTPPIETPAAGKETPSSNIPDIDQSTVDLPFETAIPTPNENASQQQIAPLTEEERLSFITALQDPLSVPFRKFRENNIIGRLKMLDATLPTEQITYTSMFGMLNLTEPEKKILSNFDSPKITMNAIARRYEAMLRVQQAPPVEQEQITPLPHNFVRNPFPQRKSFTGKIGGDGKKRAAGDTGEES